MVDYRLNDSGQLEYIHEPTNSFVPVVAPIEFSTGLLTRLISSQEDIIHDILTELQQFKTQETGVKNIELIAEQEALLNDIISGLQDVKLAVENNTGGPSTGGGDTSALETLVSSILTVELPLIKNYLSSINNKIPTGDFPVALTLTQKELLDNIISLLGIVSTNVNNIGVNTDDVYLKLQDLLDQFPGIVDAGDNLTTVLASLLSASESINTSVNTKAVDIGTQLNELNEIKTLLESVPAVAGVDTLVTKLNSVDTKLGQTLTVSLADPQGPAIPTIVSKLDQVLVNLSDISSNTANSSGSSSVSVEGIESILNTFRTESNAFRQLPVEIVERQETIINDIQAEANQIKRYMARLVDPLGEDIDGSQIAISQQIYNKLVNLETFIKGRYASNPAKIVNISLVNINSEYTFTLPADTKRYALKVRGGEGDTLAPIRFAFVSGIVAFSNPSIDDGYDTIYPEAEESDHQLSLTSPFPIYFATSDAGVTVVVKYWR